MPPPRRCDAHVRATSRRALLHRRQAPQDQHGLVGERLDDLEALAAQFLARLRPAAKA
jgi:hypothetical protein